MTEDDQKNVTNLTNLRAIWFLLNQVSPGGPIPTDELVSIQKRLLEWENALAEIIDGPVDFVRQDELST